MERDESPLKVRQAQVVQRFRGLAARIAKVALAIWAGTALLVGVTISITAFSAGALRAIASGLFWGGAGLVGVGAMVMIAAGLVAAYKRKLTGYLRLHDGKISLGRDELLRLSDITSAWLDTSSFDAHVAVEDREGRTTVLWVGKKDVAESLFDRIEAGVESSTFSTSLGEPALPIVLVLVLTPFSAGTLATLLVAGLGQAFAVVGVALAIALVWAIYKLIRHVAGPAELIVGADGIHYAYGFRTRFIPFRSIASVDVDTQGVRLDLRDDSEVVLPAVMLRMAKADVLRARINAASQLWRRRADIPSALLARRDRPIQQWRTDVEQVANTQDYRTPRLSQAGLAALVADGSAEPEQRVGAAFALMAQDREKGREKIRVAARTSADPRVRIVLSKIAEGDASEADIERMVARSR